MFLHNIKFSLVRNLFPMIGVIFLCFNFFLDVTWFKLAVYGPIFRLFGFIDFTYKACPLYVYRS